MLGQVNSFSKVGLKREISDHQVCIASAIDEFDTCFLQITGTGPIHLKKLT